MTQCNSIISWCESHDGITTLEAMHLGICRLSERIRECEKSGISFSHDPEKTPSGARVIRYRLEDKYAIG